VTGDVSGPISSHKSYTATEDAGKYVGSTGTFSDGFRVTGDVSGPTSSHKSYTATEDTSKYAGTTDTFSDGYRVNNQQGGTYKLPNFLLCLKACHLEFTKWFLLCGNFNDPTIIQK